MIGLQEGDMQWMKQYEKYFLMVSACCCFLLGVDVIAAGAQHLGVIGGLNFTSADQIHLDQVETTLENRTGYHIGAYVDLGSDLLWVRPGIEYINAGPLYEGINDNLPPEIDDEFRVRVFAVPVDVRLEFGPSFARPYVFAGPVAHFRWLSDAPDQFENNMERRDLAATVGAGVRIGGPNAQFRVVPQFRYTHGLANVVENGFTIGGTAVDPADNMSFVMLSVAAEF